MAKNSILDSRINRKRAEGEKEDKEAFEKSNDPFDEDPQVLARPIVHYVSSFQTTTD